MYYFMMLESIPLLCNDIVIGVRVSVGGFTLYRQLGSFSRAKTSFDYSVLVENKFGLFQSLLNESTR